MRSFSPGLCKFPERTVPSMSTTSDEHNTPRAQSQGELQLTMTKYPKACRVGSSRGGRGVYSGKGHLDITARSKAAQPQAALLTITVERSELKPAHPSPCPSETFSILSSTQEDGVACMYLGSSASVQNGDALRPWNFLISLYADNFPVTNLDTWKKVRRKRLTVPTCTS